MDLDTIKILLPILEAGGPTALFGWMLYMQHRSRPKNPVDNEPLLMMLVQDVRQLSKDVGTYHSAAEKADRDRHDVVLASIDESHRMVVARLEKLERA